MKRTLTLLLPLALAFASATHASATSLPANTGDNQGDTETICYNLTRDMSTVNRGTFRNSDSRTNGEVTKLQQFLHDEEYLIPAPTGFFGVKTKAAVMKYQKARGLTPVAGNVGPMTRAAIAEDTCDDDVATPVDPTKPTMCTMEARMCADGSMMPRTDKCVWQPEKCPTAKICPAGQVLGIDGKCSVKTEPAPAGKSTMHMENCEIAIGKSTCESSGTYANYSSSLHWLKLVNRKTGVTTPGVAQPKQYKGVITPQSWQTATSLKYGENQLDLADYATGAVQMSTTAYASCVLGSQWTGKLCGRSAPVGTGTTGEGKPIFNFTTAESVVNAGAQARLNWYQISNAGSCTASGGWSGLKSVQGRTASGDVGGSELVTVNRTTEYVLTCLGNGGETTKSLTITVRGDSGTGTTNPTNPTAPVRGELVFKINGTAGPIGAGVGESLIGSFSYGDTLSNCRASESFGGQSFRDAEIAYAADKKSGAMTGFHAQYSANYTGPINMPELREYSISCSTPGSHGYGQLLWSTKARVYVCPQGAVFTPSGNQYGGTCGSANPEKPVLTLKVNGVADTPNLEENKLYSGTYSSNYPLGSCSISQSFGSATLISPSSSNDLNGTISGIVPRRTASNSTAPQSIEYSMSCKTLTGVTVQSNVVRALICGPDTRTDRDGTWCVAR